MFSVEYDHSIGIIRCRIEGFLAPEDVDAIVKETKIAKETCRRLHGDMKMLVMTDGQVQSIKAMEIVKSQRASDLNTYDRRAFVLPTSLQKMQVARVFDLPNEKRFISEGAAVTWLLADREYRPNQVLEDDKP